MLNLVNVIRKAKSHSRGFPSLFSSEIARASSSTYITGLVLVDIYIASQLSFYKVIEPFDSILLPLVNGSNEQDPICGRSNDQSNQLEVRFVE
jgi:hypothetical protein